MVKKTSEEIVKEAKAQTSPGGNVNETAQRIAAEHLNSLGNPGAADNPLAKKLLKGVFGGDNDSGNSGGQ